MADNKQAGAAQTRVERVGVVHLARNTTLVLLATWRIGIEAFIPPTTHNQAEKERERREAEEEKEEEEEEEEDEETES